MRIQSKNNLSTFIPGNITDGQRRFIHFTCNREMNNEYMDKTSIRGPLNLLI